MGASLGIDDAIFQLDSPAFTGNQGATPEFTLSVLEKAQAACSDFGNAMIKVVQVSLQQLTSRVDNLKKRLCQVSFSPKLSFNFVTT
jgi:hypothetical protein